MAVASVDTRQLMGAYLDALLAHGDFARYFSEDVVATLEGVEPEQHRGRAGVREWIDAAHSLGAVKLRRLVTGEDRAAAEFDFIRRDGAAVPYVVMWDIGGGQITALRIFFTGPIA
jgi:hypothetical protein